MTQGFIEVSHVWKKFHRGELHDSLRDLVPAVARRLIGRGPRADELEQGDFWALKDVSFTVAPGQALGIIGPNGAGKSTLLKLLTKILRPNRGSCRVQGRVGALIEVAAGFHPDLTGRENVYLQGSIMGMRRAQIDASFDRIVEFSGISEFIDTPVKRYSSGMNARLGFAIAAHLEPDVLIIDEVLAVGDFAFQARAFGRIRELAERDIPVVVVSHQLDRIATLCTDCVLLDRGTVVRQGTPAECIAAYVSAQATAAEVPEGCPVELGALQLLSREPVPSGGWARLTLAGHIAEGDLGRLEPVGFRVVSTSTGQIVFASSNARCGLPFSSAGPFELELELQMNVPPGIYMVETLVWDPTRGRQVARGPSAYIEVSDGPSFYGTVQLNPRLRLRQATGAGLPPAR